jgi:hypothetical protein
VLPENYAPRIRRLNRCLGTALLASKQWHGFYQHTRSPEPMTPEDALQKQSELYRAMTDEQRLKIALDLHEFACEIARAGIRHRFPDATDDEVEQHLRRRIELSRE